MKQHSIPRRLGAWLLSFALLAGLLPVTASAADNTYDVGANGVYITQNGSYYITGKTNTNPITVGNGQDSVPVTITLDNVTIDLSGRDGTAFNIQSSLGTGSNVTLNLVGTNTLISGIDDTFGQGLPGIHLPQGASLTIQGSGSLTVTGGSGSSIESGGAGIGGNPYESCGTLTITGGTVTATGGSGGDLGNGGAGIGGGGRGAGGNVTIAGGSVTATGGSGYNGGVGIGGGTGGGAGGNVTITGGAVTVTGGAATEVAGGAGIGSGVNRDSEKSVTGSDVTITGGNVTITGGYGPAAGGAGIGGGANPFGGKGSDAGTVIILSPVTVSGGTGKRPGADIGGGQTSSSTGSAGGNGQGIRPGADGTYEAYGGSFALPNGLVIPGGATVTIPKDIVLTVPEGATLTNNGTITGAGGLTVAGDVTGSGSQSLTGTVTKKDQAGSPAAPTRQNVGSMSVTLGTQSGGVAGVEYACVQGASAAAPTEDSAWQTSPYFNDLSRATIYTFFARYKGNDFYNPSKASAGLNVTTVNGAPTVGNVVKINYQNETITFDDSKLEMNTSSSFDGTYIVNGASISEYIPSLQRYTTLSIRWKAADGMPASENGYVSIPARPETPSQAIDNATEQIAIAAGQEYQIGSADTWTAVATATNVTVAPGETISIRVAATNSAFKSETHTVTAPARASAPNVPTIDYEGETLSGTTAGMEYSVVTSGQSVPSVWEDCSDNMPLSALGWTGGEMTVYFRTAATTTNYASAPTAEALTIPARPVALNTPSATDWTDKSITITAETGVQYRLGDRDDWQSGTDGSLTFDNLTAETVYTIYARYPAVTSGTPAFASAEATLKVTTKASAGAAPTVNQSEIEVTDTTVTLPYDAAWEYRMKDSTDWNSGDGANVFTNLFHSRLYTFYVRVAETTTAEASQETAVTVWTARETPNPGEGYSIKYEAETISIERGYEVNTAEDFTGTNVFDGTSLESYIGRTLYIRRTAIPDKAPAGASVAISIPARPSLTRTLFIDTTTESVTIPAGCYYGTTSADYDDITSVSDGSAMVIAPGDSIYIYQAATNSSFRSSVLSLTAPARAGTPDAPEINFTAETVGVTTGMEYSMDGGDTWNACTADMVATAFGNWDGSAAVAVLFRVAATSGTDGQYASNSVSLTIPARPDAPEGITGGTRVINGVDTTMEYSGDGGSTWTAFTKGTVSSISAGAYLVRYAATDDEFASHPTAEITVRGPSSSGGATTYPPTVTSPENGSVSVSPKNPTRGQTVTITVEPDEGYEVDEISVIYGSGTEVEVRRNDDGTYSFVQPGSRVTVAATFREISTELPFTDVSEGAWYEDAVRFVYESGMMLGVSETDFAPEDTASRSMIVTILYRLEGEPVVDYLMGFDDVAEGEWYTEAVRWAASEGIVGGYDGSLFGTNDAVTREQFAVILCRYAAYKEYDVTVSADLSGFSDADDVSTYAVDALAWANAVGIVNGASDTTLNPKGSATRAQMAAMLQRFCRQFVES